MAHPTSSLASLGMTVRSRMRQVQVWPGKWVMLGLILFAGLLMLGIQPGPCARISASNNIPTDFCNRFTVTVTNTTGSTITNRPVPFAINAAALTAAGYLDESGWDMVPVNASYTEVDMFAQDLADSTARWWLTVPSLATDTSASYQVYLGNNETQRDNGIYLLSGENITRAHEAAWDITDNLYAEVTVKRDSVLADDAELIEHWDTNQGWALGLQSSAGNLRVYATVDGVTLANASTLWQAGWVGEEVVLAIEFVAPTLRILADGVELSSINTGLGAISSVSTDLNIGASLSDTNILNARVYSGSPRSVVANWNFGPADCTELTATVPGYTGECSDTSGNSRTLSYTLSRTATGLAVTVGPVVDTSAPLIVTVAGAVVDVVGRPFGGSDISSSGSVNTNLPGYSIVEPASEAFDNAQMFWATICIFLAVLFLAAVTLGTGKVWMGFTAACLPLTAGVIYNLFPEWVLFVWAIAGISWMASQKTVEQQ